MTLSTYIFIYLCYNNYIFFSINYQNISLFLFITLNHGQLNRRRRTRGGGKLKATHIKVKKGRHEDELRLHCIRLSQHLSVTVPVGNGDNNRERIRWCEFGKKYIQQRPSRVANDPNKHEANGFGIPSVPRRQHPAGQSPNHSRAPFSAEEKVNPFHSPLSNARPLRHCFR